MSTVRALSKIIKTKTKKTPKQTPTTKSLDTGLCKFPSILMHFARSDAHNALHVHIKNKFIFFFYNSTVTSDSLPLLGVKWNKDINY